MFSFFVSRFDIYDQGFTNQTKSIRGQKKLNLDRYSSWNPVNAFILMTDYDDCYDIGNCSLNAGGDLRLNIRNKTFLSLRKFKTNPGLKTESDISSSTKSTCR